MDSKRERRRIQGIERNTLRAECLRQHLRATQSNGPRLAINDQRTGARRPQGFARGQRFLPSISAVGADIRTPIGQKHQQSRGTGLQEPCRVKERTREWCPSARGHVFESLLDAGDMTRKWEDEIGALGAKRHEGDLVASLIAGCQQSQRGALCHFQSAMRCHRTAGIHQKQNVAETRTTALMLHEIGSGERHSLLADASPTLRRRSESFCNSQGASVLEGDCADDALGRQRFCAAPTGSVAINKIRHQANRTTIWGRRCDLQSRNLRLLLPGRRRRFRAIRWGTILSRWTEVRCGTRLTLRTLLSRSMHQGQFGGLTDMFLVDLGRGLPRRQGTCGLDDGEITSNAIQMMFHR